MSLSGLSLRDLEYVVSVADHGSFVRAAEHCRVAQPSLSAQIRKLEAWLGMTIFERTTRRVLVTAEGQRLIDHARRVLYEARNLVSAAQTSDEPWGGSLRLAAISTLGPYLFPKVLRELRTHYPSLSLVLGEGLTAALVEKLVDGELDAVILSCRRLSPLWRLQRSSLNPSFLPARLDIRLTLRLVLAGKSWTRKSGCCLKKDTVFATRLCLSAPWWIAATGTAPALRP